MTRAPGSAGGERRLAHEVVSHIPALSARLARLALEVDELAQQIVVEPLSEGDELYLAAPIAHLAIAFEWLEQALYECDRLDVTQSWARWLGAARGDQDRVHAEVHGASGLGVHHGRALAPASAPVASAV